VVWSAERKEQSWQSWKQVVCSVERKRQSWQRKGWCWPLFERWLFVALIP
jgi:hypothetical protein